MPDRRTGTNLVCRIGDIGMAAFACIFMQSPSFLTFQRMLEDRCGDSNARTLFGMDRIPCDNHIRQTLYGTPPEHFDDVFISAARDLDRKGDLRGMRRLRDRTLTALDGTEYFNSDKVKCDNCSTRTRHKDTDRETVEHCHSFLGATIVAGQNLQVHCEALMESRTPCVRSVRELDSNDSIPDSKDSVALQHLPQGERADGKSACADVSRGHGGAPEPDAGPAGPATTTSDRSAPLQGCRFACDPVAATAVLSKAQEPQREVRTLPERAAAGRPRPAAPCAEDPEPSAGEGMIPSESRMREIRTSGLMSGGEETCAMGRTEAPAIGESRQQPATPRT